jgi:hypothetical protein
LECGNIWECGGLTPIFLAIIAVFSQVNSWLRESGVQPPPDQSAVEPAHSKVIRQL